MLLLVNRLKSSNQALPAPAVSVPESAGRTAALGAAVRVDRALTELRRGRLVRLVGDGCVRLVAAVETLSLIGWQEMAAIAATMTSPEGGSLPSILLTLSADRVRASRAPVARRNGSVIAIGAAADRQALVGRLEVQPDARPDVPLDGRADGHLDVRLDARLRSSVSLDLPVDFDLTRLGALAGIDGTSHRRGGPDFDDETVAIEDPGLSQTLASALEMARLARLVPAVISIALPVANASSSAMRVAEARPAAADVLSVGLGDLLGYPQDRATTLLRVSEAPVPLAGQENSRFVLFRETAADIEHVAIIVGNPDPKAPVLVRMHSSCLTGDLFGSLRCDCGDQLRGAISRLSEGDEGGVLLYLAQEGRGIGLANKLRAYACQDNGFDTIDADRYLGFSGDERSFGVAAQMLRALGIDRVRLLTNNPSKIEALGMAGIDVVERLAIGAPVNRHNARYLATKRDRAGHLIDVSLSAP